MIASVVFFVILMVFQMVFTVAGRAEGRDLRRTQALWMAAELIEQVGEVHAAKGDLPVRDGIVTPTQPATTTIYTCPGGQMQLTADVPQFVRTLKIEEFRMGKEDQLVRPDRAYLVTARVTYPGPIGEEREEVLTTVRSRAIRFKTIEERPPWE
jgi:hypothetical protein